MGRFALFSAARRAGPPSPAHRVGRGPGRDGEDSTRARLRALEDEGDRLARPLADPVENIPGGFCVADPDEDARLRELSGQGVALDA